MSTASKKRRAKTEPILQSGTRNKKPEMLPIVPNQRNLPPRVVELATRALLEARRKIAGVFADEQPSLFPELDEEPTIPAQQAEAIVREADKNIDPDENVGFKIEDGKIRIVPFYRSRRVYEPGKGYI